MRTALTFIFLVALGGSCFWAGTLYQKAATMEMVITEGKNATFEGIEILKNFGSGEE